MKFTTNTEVRILNNPLQRFIAVIFIILCMGVTLISCSNTNTDLINREAKKISAVSIVNPDFQSIKGQTVAWHAELVVAGKVFDEDFDLQIKELITTSVTDAITKKGYSVISDKENADYLLSAAIFTGDVDIKDISSVMMYPGLAKSVANLEKGSLLVTLGRHEKNSTKLMWQGTVNAYVVGDSLSVDYRSKRIKSIVASLFRSFPEGE